MDQVLGQARAVETLQTGLATGRLHHAYIFHGPGGVGKFTTALAFARVLLCQQPQRSLTGVVEACGQCDSCRLLRSGAGASQPAEAAAHPDLHVVTKELATYSDDRQIRQRKLLSIPVEVLREALLEPVTRRAQMTGGTRSKVFIVDEAELLNPTGQNLLLKTLEEPPPGSVIILVTASEDRLLPTIRSRCQRVGFLPLPEEVVTQWVDGREEAGRLSTRERQWLIAFAGGSLGRAQLALDYDLAQWARGVLPVINGLVTGAASDLAPGTEDVGQRIAAMIDDFAQQWVTRHQNASKEAANKLAAGLMWSMIATHARAKLAALAAQGDPADPLSAEAMVEPWLGVIDAVDQAQRLLGHNVNLSVVCDHLVTQMARPQWLSAA